MNIGIYTTVGNTTIRQLSKAIEKRGHKIFVINKLYFEPTNPKGVELPPVDLVYYWIGAGAAGRTCFFDFLNKKNIKCVNSAFSSDPLFVNKIYQSYRVSQNNILAPKTIVQTKASYEILKERLGEKIIVKAAVGSCGTQVRLIKNEDELKRAQDEFLGKELLYQTLIRNDGDYRVHVIGGKAVCVYKRTPAEGDFRANVSRGGGMEKVEDENLKEKLFRTAEKIVESFVGAEIMGIDLIHSMDDDQLYFIETNELPGIKQVHEVTGIDVADKMVEYFESLVI